MKISELQELLEKFKAEYGDIEVKVYECGEYVSTEFVGLVDDKLPESGVEIY